MSGAQVDRIIAIYEEHGPPSFELSQLTRISPETYKIVEPALQDGALHFDGETIELDPANAQKIAAVVAGLRRQAGGARRPAAPRGIEDRIADLDKRCSGLIADPPAASSISVGWSYGPRLPTAHGRVPL